MLLQFFSVKVLIDPLIEFLDSVLVSYFSDTACGQNTVVAEEKYYFGCAYKVEDYYYATSYYSTELLCTQRTDVPPLPSLDGTYAVQRYIDY